MAGLFVTRGEVDTARTSFSRQGFGTPIELQLNGWRMLHWPYIAGGPETLLCCGDDVVAVAGTLTIDGRSGRAALEFLLTAVTERGPDWSRFGGHFAALVHRGGRTFLFCDRLSLFQLYRDERRTLFSTSLLAAAESLPCLHFDAQGVYEHAFNVTALGDDTLFEELKLVGPGMMWELTPQGAVLREAPPTMPDISVTLAQEERIARQCAALDRVFNAHLDKSARVHCPLSGGLDSRLVLGCLRRIGAEAQVYVYGPPGDEDVEIAGAIGAALGFPVAWTDKQQARIDPDAFPDMVLRNFLEQDGGPTFGNIFDNGGHLSARDARHAGGLPAVSGGGGEVFRNFFYLADRPLTAEAVARAFYARFVTADATDLFTPRQFLRRIRDKMLDALGRPGDREPLPRLLVEQLYPRFRCRALFGREISLEARHGPYLMPFLEHDVVVEAASLPVASRNAGRFEAALMNAVDPVLAAQPSAYGHDFAGPPDRRHRFVEWSSRIRPVWLRERSYAFQRQFRTMGDEHGGLLEPDYLGRVIDPDYPVMRRFFNVERINDSGLLRRIACLEYLAAYLGSRLQP